MNVLITGGFGSVGVVTVDECLRRGYAVTVFDVRSKRTRNMARKYGKRHVRAIFGDIRNPDDVSRAVQDQDMVLHLAAILPPFSDRNPDLCRAVNAGGTANLIAAMQASPLRPALVSVSSASVMGSTQSRRPPVGPNDPLIPSDAYSSSKVEAEAMVVASGLKFCILRLAAVIPTILNLSSIIAMIKLLFDMPLDARCEIVIDLDVAHALVSAGANLVESGDLLGKKGFIAGGGPQGCQMRTRDLVDAILIPLGLPLPDEALYSAALASYYLDWYDTDETQSILDFQRHSLQQWQEIIRTKLRLLLPIIRLFGPIIVNWIERQSPLYGHNPS